MTTLAEAEAHRKALLDLTALAMRDLVGFWESLDLDDPRRVAALVREWLPELLAAYGLAAGTLAADFYDDQRHLAGLAAGFVATAADGPTGDDAQAIAGWSLAPLFNVDQAEASMLADEYGVKVEARPVPDPRAALSRLAGATQRAVALVDRDTIARNAAADPAGTRYARHASANACAFCAMLAARGAVYREADSAGGKYHNHCHCIAVPVFPGRSLEEAPYVSDWRDAYYSATEDLGGASDTKAILARMRQTTGLR